MSTNYLVESEIQKIIDDYNFSVGGIDQKAKIRDGTDRAYGGIVRSDKGTLVENTAKQLVKIAWTSLGRNLDQLTFSSNKVRIHIKEEYISKIQNPDVKQYILNNKNKYFYALKTDVHVFINNTFAIAVECKAYTENAMFKRILVDFTLLKQVYPDLDFVLLQLESQLGGDYSSLSGNKLGSPSTHTLMSYFEVDVNIITLLEGERLIDKPIHKSDYFKPLKKQKIYEAIEIFQKLLEKHL